MPARPRAVTSAVILSALVAVTDLPFPWWYLFPGAEDAPDFVVYSGTVLAIVGLVVLIGLWLLKPWSFWATIVVMVLNFLLSAPGVFEAPGVALRAFIAVTAVVAALVIALVLLPSSRAALQGASRRKSAQP
jgi:hypothetical protein